MRKSYAQIYEKCVSGQYHFTRKYRYWVDFSERLAVMYRVEVKYLGTMEYASHVQEVYRVEI